MLRCDNGAWPRKHRRRRTAGRRSREGRWPAARALVRGGARPRGDARGLRRAELGGVVARRRGRRSSPRASARTASTSSAATRPAPRGWRRGSRPTSSTSTAPRRSRADGCGARIGCSIRSSRGPTTAGSPSTRATSPTPAATRRRRASSARSRAELGRRFGVADLEMLGLALEGAALVASRAGRGGHALPRRGDGGGARGRGDDPDLGRVGVLLPRQRLHGRARLRARRSSGATGSPSSPSATGAATCSRSAAPSTARSHLWRGRWAEAEAHARGRGRRLRALAPGLGGGAARRRWPSCGGGRAGRGGARRCSTGPAPSGRRSSAARRLALDARRGAAGRRARSSGCCARCPATAGSTALPALELLVRARIARGELDEAAAALEALREVARLVGTRAAAGARRPGRGHARGRRAATTSGARTLLEDAVDGFERAARRSRPRWRGSSSRRACVALGRAERPSARRRAALERFASSARRGGGAREARRSPRRRRRRPLARSSRAREREVLRPARRGADEPADRRAARGQRAHRPPPRDQHPAQARPPLAHGRGRPRRAGGLLDARR